MATFPGLFQPIGVQPRDEYLAQKQAMQQQLQYGQTRNALADGQLQIQQNALAQQPDMEKRDRLQKGLAVVAQYNDPQTWQAFLQHASKLGATPAPTPQEFAIANGLQWQAPPSYSVKDLGNGVMGVVDQTGALKGSPKFPESERYGQPINAVNPTTGKPEQYVLGPDGKPQWLGTRPYEPPRVGDGESKPQLVDVQLPDGTIQKQWVKPGQAAGVPVGAPGTDKAAQRNSTTLRKEFDALDSTKNYRTVLPLYERARTAPNTRAGDISVIYALGKMFDPTSVVREGELKLSMNSAPWLQKIVSEANSQVTGQGSLNPQMRAAILDALKGQVDAAAAAYQQTRQQYSGYAQDYGVDPNQIVGPDPSAAFPDTSKPSGIAVGQTVTINGAKVTRKR